MKILAANYTNSREAFVQFVKVRGRENYDLVGMDGTVKARRFMRLDCSVSRLKLPLKNLRRVRLRKRSIVIVGIVIAVIVLVIVVVIVLASILIRSRRSAARRRALEFDLRGDENACGFEPPKLNLVLV